MARITSKRLRDGYRVRIAGRLCATDLRRLERACGPALERHNVALAINVSAVTAMDAAANAFVERLVERGARLVHGAPTPAEVEE